MELGINNTLICYVTGFYPPHVEVSWTKNEENVTDRATLSRYYPNDDGTYKLVSHLRIIPAKGDVYTCTVEHTALARSLIKIWGEIYYCLHTDEPERYDPSQKLIMLSCLTCMFFGLGGIRLQTNSCYSQKMCYMWDGARVEHPKKKH